MPYSSGTFSLVAGNPVVTGSTISSTTHNNTNNDIATGLSTCILKDGTQTATATIPFTNITASGTLAVTGTSTQAAINTSGLITSTVSGQFFGRSGASTGIQYLRLQNTTGDVSIGIEGSAGGAILTGTSAYSAVISVSNAAPVHLASNNTLGFSLNTTGQAVLGSANTVVLNGWLTETFSATAYNGIVLNDSASQSAGGFAQFAIAGTAIGSITRNAATSAVLFNTTSDYRVKDLFGPFTGATALLRSLTVHDGQFKGAKFREPLLVAHEVQAVTPWSVTGEKDAVNEDGTPKYQQLAMGTHEALLIAGWKEHDNSLEQLRADFAAYVKAHP